jgi:hypothetical protein
MSGATLEEAFRKILLFTAFIIGIFTSVAGVVLTILSFINNVPYKIEGTVFFLLGIIILFLADQSILNTERHNINKQLIKDNKILNQRSSSGFQGQTDMTSFMTKLFGENNVTSSFEVVSSFDHFDDSSSGTTSEADSNSIKKIMIKANLNEEDASTAYLLKGKSKTQLKEALNKSIQDDRFELSQFIEKMIQEKKD